MFYYTISKLITIMLSMLVFKVTIVEFQSKKETAAGKEITTSSGRLNLKQLLTTSRT